MKLYLLKLEDDCWYVGISSDPVSRIDKHCSGTGAAWTKLHKPLEPISENNYIVDLEDLNRSECERTEDEVTVVLQDEFGLNKVRGGTMIFCRNMKIRPSRSKRSWVYFCLKSGFAGMHIRR
ncbi:MAG: hypothetical protein OSB66_03280 [SAR202 cluster bacterium]|nr:hypothetical protein [SAR202 cluster bacterium]